MPACGSSVVSQLTVRRAALSGHFARPLDVGAVEREAVAVGYVQVAAEVPATNTSPTSRAADQMLKH